jgi:ectoine hydroxylase-related dioxygenase (phytanoyl-CoA dioxygenase family)
MDNEVMSKDWVADDKLVMSQEDISFFKDSGYLVVRNITNSQDLSELRQIYERMFRDETGLDDGNYFDLASAAADVKVLPQMTDMVRYEPAIRDTLVWKNAEIVARQLLEPTATYMFDHGILKPPNGPATRWHQDFAYYDIFTRYRSVTFWIPLQDATAENGCMWFVPGSHLRPLLAHQPLDNNPKIHALEIVDQHAHNNAVACPINAGDCTIHHPLTIHGTGPNLTSEPRLAYGLAFGTQTKRSLIRREFSWNMVKNTERRRRQFSSLSTFGKVKYVAKVGLIKVGLY